MPADTVIFPRLAAVFSASGQPAWLKSGLFWRTFFLLAVLIMLSMAAWVGSFRMVERAPRAQQIAAQVVSIVTITRAALTHSAPDLRRELLFELASNEGIRIYPLEETDLVHAPSPGGLMADVRTAVKSSLGADTRFASSVNGVAGFWVSFRIEDDAYWLMLDRERISRNSSLQWLGWAAVVLMLSLLGAVFISRLINQPLARLTAAARAIARGQAPEVLPEKGPTEIEEANRSFNQMVDDLKRVETDRAVVLAGISHDLRTPLARMLLELEMASGLDEDARAGMQSDLGQMDAIIGQFLDYARPADTGRFSSIDISALLTEIGHTGARLPDVRISTSIQPDLQVLGNPTELKRVFDNLLENARRYGKNDDSEVAAIDFRCQADGAQIVIEITDQGPGLPEAEMSRLIKPFARMDAARSQVSGAGLGLAIVDRVIKRHSGVLRLRNRAGGGLIVQITLPRLAA
ncbi:MAG TPA: ATP-binding protein [Burkholderiaceae bacterium]|nr:ATP-binding protein [Burkholderiaceae bacterium]